MKPRRVGSHARHGVSSLVSSAVRGVRLSRPGPGRKEVNDEKDPARSRSRNNPGRGNSNCQHQRPEGAESWWHERKLGWLLPRRVEWGGDEVDQIM